MKPLYFYSNFCWFFLALIQFIIVIIGWGKFLAPNKPQNITWTKVDQYIRRHIDGSAQDNSNSNALAMELLQSCTKPSIYGLTAPQGTQ